MNTQKKLSLVSLASIVALVGFAVWQRQYVSDWFRLRGYTPSTAVVELANKTTMNPQTRKVFYVNHPSIEDKTTFGKHCNISEETIVLGCYISNSGIFIFNVQDSRLKGVLEVTSAHEVLHAEYDRLSSSDRKWVDSKVTSFYATITDKRIKDTVEAYRKRDAKIVPDELHSILATEVKNLSPELENYYKRYFTDRKAIVSYSDQYEKVFTDIKNQIEDYQKQLDSRKKQIDINQNLLEKKSAQLQSERQELDELLRSGKKSEYNSRVESFNAQIRDYNYLVATTKSLIESYNNIVQIYNKLAANQQTLIQSLNGNLSGQTTN